MKPWSSPCVMSLLLLLGAQACGGEDRGPRPAPELCRPLAAVSDTADPGSGPVDCRALDGYELYLIDDFENSPRTSWYTNSDRTAEQLPVPDQTVPSSPLFNGGRCVGTPVSSQSPSACESLGSEPGSCTAVLPLESRKGVHVRSGLLTSNGGQLGMDLPIACGAEQCELLPGPPEVGPCSPTGQGSGLYNAGQAPSIASKGCHAVVDYSAWEGIVLWARVAPGSASFIRVRASDGRVDEKGCVCSPYTDQNDSSNGCDKWGTTVNLDSTFRAYFFPFSAMQQGGWGLKSDRLDTRDLFSIGIEWGRGTWDLWIDDVAFYRRRP